MSFMKPSNEPDLNQIGDTGNIQPEYIVDDPSSLKEQTPQRKEIKPSVFAKVFINHTKKTCCIGILIPILCLLIIIASKSLDLSGSSSREFFVTSDIRTQLSDARSAARDDFPYVADASSSTSTLQQRETDPAKNINILVRGIIEGSDGKLATIDDFKDSENLLTRESFALQKQAEDIFYKHVNYSRYCKKESGALDCDGNERACALPNSYLNHPLLYGIQGLDGAICGRRDGNELVSEENFQRFLNDMFGDDSLNVKNYFDSNLTSSNRFAWASKSTILIGSPFAGFESSNDDSSNQTDLFVDWAEPLTKPINEDESLSTDKVDIYIVSSDLLNSEFNSIITGDLTLAVIAIILVLLIIWIHTSSLVLATSAITQMILAFPFAYFVYYFIFRQLYFSTLQVLTIFLILGIGADDVFVFTDAWKQATVTLGKDIDLISRMSWTYRRAVRAMTVTSFTTAAAFFVTATSPIMPISTLGVWAGSLVLLQFLLVITVYPCAVIIWHRYWRPRLFVRGFKKVPEDELEKEQATPFFYRILPSKMKPEVKIPQEGEYRTVERFFRGPWMKFITSAKYVLLIVALGLAGFSIYRATTLDTPQESESFLPEDHPFLVATNTISDGFPRGDIDLQIQVWVTWGIEGVDRSGLSRYDVDEIGKAVFDNSFDLKQESVQNRILEACSFFGENENLIIEEGTGLEPIDCWIQDYKDWRRSVGRGDSFETFANDETLVSELLEFGNAVINETRPYFKHLRNQRIGFDKEQSKVLFTEVGFVGNIEAQAPESLMSPVYDEWQEELIKFNEASSEQGNKAIATAGYTWIWMNTQKTLLRTMISGLGIMIIVALCTLLVSTQNIIVALLATLCISGVVAMLLGFISIIGWYLGVTESVSVIIGIGYSFDGVAHMATAFVESKEHERELKLKHALTDLGISVFFGSITTLCAGLALTPAVIIFFTKFAVLLIATVILSLLWSLMFFPAALLIIGPNGEFGSILPLIRKLNCFKGRSKSNENQQVAEDAMEKGTG